MRALQGVARVVGVLGGAIAGVVERVDDLVERAVVDLGQAMRGVVGVLDEAAVRVRDLLEQARRPVVEMRELAARAAGQRAADAAVGETLAQRRRRGSSRGRSRP